MNQFSELTLDAHLHTNLARNLFTTPTPVQAQSIPPALEGLDIVATAQTGTGKTLAFLLPIMQRLLTEQGSATAQKAVPAIRSLILSPTRELAIQIADSFNKLAPLTSLRAAVVVGGLSEQPQLNAIRRGVQVIIATPGRLEDFLGRRLINLSAVSMLVLDEADRMLDMGFLPAIEKILSVIPQARQSMFFSATMEREVERLIARHSKNPVRISIGSAPTRASEQVDLHFYEVENEMKLSLLQHMLKEEEGSFLVFSRTKHGTDKLAKKLSAMGLRATAMHGNRTQNQRNQALAGFRDGRYRVLVATDVAARGIHVDSVAHVVNFDLPQSPDDFIHRIGRTGRAGQRGSASTFVSRSERGEMRRIERDCRVKLMRREITPEMLERFAELASQAPVSIQPEQYQSPLARAHHKGGPGSGNGNGAGPKRRSFGPPRRFSQSSGRP